MTPITGARIVIGNSGLVDGALDDPAVRERALAALRSCGYLDVIDGVPVGHSKSAAGAVAAAMRLTGTAEGQES
jgi:hypothetical protein